MKTKSLVNAAMIISIYLVFLIVYTIGILPTITSLLLPIPIIVYSLISRKITEISLFLIGCCIGAFLLTSVLGLLATIIYGLSGFILGWGLIKGWKGWQRITNSAFIYMVGFPLMIYFLTGMWITDVLIEMFTESINRVEAMLPELAEQVEVMQTAIMGLPQLMPALLLLTGILLSYLSDLIARIILRRLKLPAPQLENIQKFQLGRILGIGYLTSQFVFGIVAQPMLSVILLNVLLLLDILFKIQGIVVLTALLKIRIGGIGRGVIIFILFIFFPGFLSIVGVMDAIFGYRDRFEKGNL